MSEASFKRWWRNEGSGLTPFVDHDYEEHAHRIAKIAWSNGEYTANAHTRLVVQDLNATVLDLRGGVKELTDQVLSRDAELEGYEDEYYTWRFPALLVTAVVGLAFVMSRFL